VFRTLRRAALALVFAGLGFAALHHRKPAQSPVASGGRVELPFDT
jgi:hypothetical protein